MEKRKKATIMALILTLSVFACLLVVNPVEAITWHTFITVTPNPCGVNQTVVVIFGFTMPTRGYGFPTYEDWTIIITKPDGTKITKGPYDTDSTGLGYMTFTPDSVGTWKIKAHYPGGLVSFGSAAWNWINLTVPAADTEEVELTVTEEPAWIHPPFPLPTGFWNYPIYAEHREWHWIADNWLLPGYDTSRQFDWGSMNGPYAPYTKVPKTPHILWTKPTLFGGLIGGPYGDDNYYTGLAYRRELQPPVIINGRLYYKQMEPPGNGFWCVDVYTGETIWYVNASYPDGKGGIVAGSAAQITCGQILNVDTRNWHGGVPYLWSTGSTTWAVWDPWTGQLIFTIINAIPIATDGYGLSFVFDNIGSLITFYLNTTDGTILMWNSSKLIDTEVGLAGMSRSYKRYNLDWKKGIEWKVPVEGVKAGWAIMAFDPKNWSVLILSNQTRGAVQYCDLFEDVAFNVKTKSVMWRKIRSEGTWEYVIGGRAMSMEDGIYTICRKETRQIYAYSISTGEQVWVTDPRPSYWATFWIGMAIVYGKVYAVAYDGICDAYDAKTGKLVWRWGPVNAGAETPYGVYPLYGGLAIADGIVWVFNGEHSADKPLYRGERMYGINATTGETVWNISGWYQQPVFANNLIIAPNGYDGQIYCFGKGPTLTTVTVPETAQPLGTTILIKGRVLDISPGTKSIRVAWNFPDGLPAVADECMGPWMEHVYMQKPRPANIKGVWVSFDAIAPNGTWIHIGGTHTDSYGMYTIPWNPPTEGIWTIVITFPGTESYWPSYTQTTIQVTAAPTAPAAPAYTTMDIAIITAVIIAIIIGIATLYMILKRK
ncbi:MAG: PQQ-binding-like beta-propeller repeat protein [Candidatus Bathyarchaeia archaeon]